MILLFIAASTFTFLAMPKPEYPKPGNYTVYEIKEKYVLAKNENNDKVIIYGIQNPSYYDIYSLKHFEKISGQHNIGLFSFDKYMANQNIFYSSYSSDKQLIERDEGIKSKLFLWLKKKSNPILMKVLYGIQAEDFINRLGMPLIAFLSMIENYLKKYKLGSVFTFFIGCSFLILFSQPISLLRWLCFKLGKMLQIHWQHSFVFSFFLFYCIEPYHLTDFAFVLPSLLTLNYHFHPKPKIGSFVILLGCMIFYFHKIDIPLLLLFPFIRKLYALSIPLLIPSIYFTSLISFWNLFTFVPSYEWHYNPSFLFCISAFVSVYYFFKNQNKKSIQTLLFCGCLIFIEPYIDPFFSVYMIDIGQGDCSLIVEPFHKSAIMIDVGQNLYHDNVELFVKPFLEQKHIDHLDALIVTHDDFDHSGGVEALKKSIPIRKIIRTHEDTVPVEYPMYSLLPERETSDENSKSIVSYFVYDNVHFLWTGDAGTDIEKQMMKQYDLSNVDILKLGHHGSKTSSSFEFLDTTRPLLGLVSAGVHNRYGHPDSNVMAHCHQLGIHTLATKDVGMIEIKTWHYIAFFHTENGLVGWLNVH